MAKASQSQRGCSWRNSYRCKYTFVGSSDNVGTGVPPSYEPVPSGGVQPHPEQAIFPSPGFENLEHITSVSLQDSASKFLPTSSPSLPPNTCLASQAPLLIQMEQSWVSSTYLWHHTPYLLMTAPRGFIWMLMIGKIEPCGTPQDNSYDCFLQQNHRSTVPATPTSLRCSRRIWSQQC